MTGGPTPKTVVVTVMYPVEVRVHVVIVLVTVVLQLLPGQFPVPIRKNPNAVVNRTPPITSTVIIICPPEFPLPLGNYTEHPVPEPAEFEMSTSQTAEEYL